MNNISLIKTYITSTGCVHAQVKINGSDVGMLYLNPTEIDVLTNILRNGLINSETTLETDLSVDEEYFTTEDSEY